MDRATRAPAAAEADGGAMAPPSEAGPRAGDHVCCIYRTEAEHRAVITPFLRDGLARGEQILYLVDAHTAELVQGYLREDGFDVAPLLASGQLKLETARDAYLRHGEFAPDGMVGLLAEATEASLDAGFTALRITGEMTWALRGTPPHRLIEYEAKLNHFFPGNAALAICQYDARAFPPEVLLDVLTTHPKAMVGTEVYDNFYYMPPDDFLGKDRAEATLEHRVRNLRERKRLDEERLQGLAKAREVELLRAQNAFKTQFINNAAHELNTPLTPIKLQLDLVRQAWEAGEHGPREQRALALFERNVDRLARLVQDVLDAARLQGGHLRVRPQPLDLEGLVRDAADAYGEAARRAGLRLETEVEPGLRATGDPTRLSQVLFNLLGNAVRYTPAGGRVRIAAERRGEEAWVRVEDTGAGLTGEQIVALFQPFGQAHEPADGTGLGLYISKGIVELHGGRIWAESGGAGAGAAFTFAIPLAPRG